jgi:small subunit ribosomal protein S6
MKKYELLVILNAKLDETANEVLVEKVKGYLEAAQANIVKVDKWGLKKLAYPIRYQNEGYYVIFEFEAPATTISSVEPKLRIEENLMRVMFTAK